MSDTALYEFQRIGVRRIRDADGRIILADELGLGKTVQSLHYALKYLPTDPPGPIIVVCPAHLKLHWRDQFQSHMGKRVEILYGQRVPRDKPPPFDPNTIIVINYEILVPPHWKSRTKPTPDAWIEYLARLNPRLLIGDEAQKLKSSRTSCTRAFRRLARKCPRTLLLTGTPLSNNPIDLWSLLNIIDPKRYPSEMEFGFKYTFARKQFGGWKFTGARNLDELNRELIDNHLLIRRRKIDVLDQLPPITHTVIPIELDLTEYRAAERNFLGWLAKKSPQMAASAARAEEITKLTYLKQLAGRLKVESGVVQQWVADLLDETGGKLLLGVIHHSVSGLLMKHFGKSAVLVDGTVSGDDKDAMWHRFNNDPECRILVGNVDSAGTGKSCTSTSDGALLELPWKPSQVEQFFGRLHGIGRGLNGNPVHARYLVAAETLEESLCQILQRKSAWSNKAIDGIGGSGDLDIFTQIRNIIKERNKR